MHRSSTFFCDVRGYISNDAFWWQTLIVYSATILWQVIAVGLLIKIDQN
jgi:uncharacterized membrane protein YhaH (DUF805 family)